MTSRWPPVMPQFIMNMLSTTFILYQSLYLPPSFEYLAFIQGCPFSFSFSDPTYNLPGCKVGQGFIFTKTSKASITNTYFHSVCFSNKRSKKKYRTSLTPYFLSYSAKLTFSQLHLSQPYCLTISSG